MAYTLQKLMFKKCYTFRKKLCLLQNLEMQGYLIAIKRIASYITALLIPLDFRVHSFISFTVFAYTATKKKGTHYVMCVRCALFHSSMHWTDSPGPQGDFCWACQGFAHILPSAHLTSIGLIKQQLHANRKSSLRQKENSSAQKCMATL